MDNQLIKDIIEWDVVNWSKALNFWESKVDLKNEHLKCLELGSRSGGLSLWLANKGLKVICSDLENPHEIASQLHHRYEGLKIKYEAINALSIPYENEFDIIVFKSILGGVSRGEKNERKKQALQQMHKALKPGGKLLFAENLVASSMHKFLRKHFVKWGNDWNYLHISEVKTLFSNFKEINYTTVGFFGAFGRNEKQRKILGKLDSIVESILPKNQHYILIGVAEK